MPETIKVLLDTDIGTDIDDAVCLAYLLSHPRCELLGITTVTGEAGKRAMLASALCRRAGKDVPIYPGAVRPLLLEQRQNHARQAEALAHWSHETRFPQGEAVEFLRRTIRRHPGEVVLLTIAPLTNIGLLFSVDPEIPQLLRGLVMMCGRFLDPPPEGYNRVEWNAVVDAHASSIVYRSGVRLHRSIGLDVTSKVSMSPVQFKETYNDIPLFAPVLEWSEIWFREWAGTTFHDPLAAATIFEPSLCTYQRGRVSVDLVPGEDLGLTRWAPANSGGSPELEADAAHEIGVKVDVEKFFDHYRSIVRGNL